MSALPAVVTVNGTDLLYDVQGSTDLKLTISQLSAYIAAITSTTGDCTTVGSGAAAITCLKTGGVSFGSFATGTDAANLTGTVPAAALPAPSASTLGGVESLGAVSHNFLTSISTLGVPVAAQPACADISDAGAGCSGNAIPANLTLTNPASAATFTLAGGKTFVVNNGLTLATTSSTDGLTFTLPSTNATIARTDAAQTFSSGTQTFSGLIIANSGIAVVGGQNAKLSTITASTNAHAVELLNNAFTVSGTGLGTSPAVNVTTGSWTTEITVGSAPANATFTMTNAAVSTGWTCSINDVTSNSSIVIGQTSFTTTTAVFQAYSRTTGATAALTASDVLLATCAAF